MTKKMARMVVYLITNLVNGKHYVGKTTGLLKKRWMRHLSDTKRGVQTYPLHNAIRKYGPEAFSIVPLVRILETDPQLKEQERFWIRVFRSNNPRYGYNLTAGGDGLLEHRASVETRRKISEALTGKVHSAEHSRKISAGNKGKVRSAETRRKISEANKGKVLSAETRRKVGEAGKGRSVSAETRRKMSEAQKGNKNAKAKGEK